MNTFLSKGAGRYLIAILVVAAAIAAVTITQRQPAQAAAQVTASTDDRVIVFINRGENTVPAAVPFGVDFRFNSPIYKVNTGEVVGSDSGVCEQLPPRDGIVDEYMCDTVFTFNNSSNTITASGKQRITATTAVGAVTGGTGIFQGCDGTVTGTATAEPGVFRITLKLHC